MEMRVSSIVLDSLKEYEHINLSQLNSVELLNRSDTKYIFNEKYLLPIISDLKSHYNLLQIASENIYLYTTTYYDTLDYLFYKQHQNGNKKRFKIRKRSYSSSSDIYFEIKEKNNKDKTIKNRFPFNGKLADLDDLAKSAILKSTGLGVDELEATLEVQFFRFTMSDKNFKERVTIDTQINVKKNELSKSFDRLVIAEVKQDSYNSRSEFFKILKKYKIFQSGFSKYCMGLINLNNNLKHNRFKPQLMKLNKILKNNYKDINAALI